MQKYLETSVYTDAVKPETFNIQSHLAREIEILVNDRLKTVKPEVKSEAHYPSFSTKTEAEQVEEIKRELCSDQSYTQNIRFQSTISHNFNYRQIKNDAVDLQSVI